MNPFEQFDAWIAPFATRITGLQTLSDVTSATGGTLAWICAVELALIAKALGPDMRGFPCVPRALRIVALLTATSYFVRGAMVVTSLNGVDPRHIHWDMPFGWGSNAVLMGMVLVYVLKQRVDPEVRQRLERRFSFRMARVKDLERLGQHADAKLVAEGNDAVLEAYQIGLPKETVRQLREMDDSHLAPTG